jgi:oxalate---CoA ligase
MMILLNALQPPKFAKTALVSTDGITLSYTDLYEQIDQITHILRAAGIGGYHRVAIVLPDGVPMAVTFLGVACAATAAPLNPSYRAEEFRFYLDDLEARVVLVPEDSPSPVRMVATELGIPVLEVGWRAGILQIWGATPFAAAPAAPAQSDDVALILHTSGTTARPKLVPLTQRNLCTSALNVARLLALSTEDRCLNLMPLFHIHGLVAGLLASLSVGGSIVCPSGFSAPDFFSWLRNFHPTWYTAVPTMHQAILSRAVQHADVLEEVQLRFIRSSSASLPSAVMAALEESFHAPVIEAYGMTEAAHQMASNLLPPALRKPGSVGLPAGPEIQIMDETGRILSSGETGEVVIRGENVMVGYQNNPEANAAAFTDGWFRTGDQGWFDEDGYLFLSAIGGTSLQAMQLINRINALLAVDLTIVDFFDAATIRQQARVVQARLLAQMPQDPSGI